MLKFVDKTKAIRIIRIENTTGVKTKTSIGSINKQAPQISDEVAAAVTEHEIVEIQSVIEGLLEDASLNRRLSLLRLPATLREAQEHLAEYPDPAAAARLVDALQDALRAVRKLAA